MSQEQINQPYKGPFLHVNSDKTYEMFRAMATGFLSDIVIHRIAQDPKSKFKDNLSKLIIIMATGLFSNREARERFFPKEVKTVDDIEKFLGKAFNETEAKSRDFMDFLMLAARSQFPDYADQDNVKTYIKGRLKRYFKTTLNDWQAVLDADKGSGIDEESKLREKLKDQAFNHAQLFGLIHEDMKKSTSMDIFCYYLRKVGFQNAGNEIKLLMEELVEKDVSICFKKLLGTVAGIRKADAETQKGRRQTNNHIDAIVDGVIPGRSGEDPFDVQVSDEDRKAVEEITKATEDLLQPEPASELIAEQHDAHYKAYLEYFVQEADGFEEQDFEDTGQINRKGSSKARIWAIRGMLGVAAMAVLISGGILYKRNQNRVSQDNKGKNPSAKMTSLETTDPPNKTFKIPEQVKQADAAVAPPQPTPAPNPPGPKKLVTNDPVPAPITPAPAPNPVLKKSNPHLKKIAVSSVNDLPAYYSDRYKSLFLGQEINLHGDSMTGYIEKAVREVANPVQWKKFQRFLEGKMKPGWAMYMASMNDPWFENIYKKKYRGWYNKGKKDLKKYEGLLKRKEMGKKLSSKQERLLSHYEEQMRVGKSIMLSLIPLNPNKDVNDTKTAKFSNEEGDVAGIVIEVADTTGLRGPEIIVTENIKAPVKQLEIQLADLEPDQNAIQAGQELLKKVQQIESQQAVQAALVSQSMLQTVENLLVKHEKRQEEKSKMMEAAVDKLLAGLEPKTDNDYYDSIEIQKPPSKDEQPEDYYLSYQVEQPAKVSDPVDDYYELIEIEKPVAEVKPTETIENYYASIEIEKPAAEVKPVESDEDYYSEVSVSYEDEDYAQVEVTKEDPIENYYASVEVEKTVEQEKPKGIFGRVKSWFSRKAA